MISVWQAGDRLPDCPPLSIRVGSFLDAYGTGYPFARFWRQDTGALCLVDGCLTVLCESCDEELAAFLLAVSPKSVWSNRLLLPERQRAYAVWHKRGRGEIPDRSPPVSYREVYDTLAQAFSMPDWETWYVDVCHRVRHGTALALSLENGALCSAVHHGQVLLTGVAVPEAFRRQGVATRLLRAAEAAASDVFAITESGEADAFYRACGYAEVGCVYGC